MSQEDKPVAAQEPVFAFRRKGQESFCTCNEDRYNELAQKPNLFEVTKFYANAAPDARCKELECDVAHWKANHDNRVEAARLLIDRPDLPLERVKAYQAHIALQAKITEQAALISELEARETILVRSNSSLNIQNKALGAEAADRESFLKTLADTCTEAERIAIERAGRIDALEAECRKLRDALSETEAFCNRKDITIECQRKVIEDAKTAAEASRTALSDWMHVYADDMCDPEKVVEARARINKKGTLAYIADAQVLNRNTLVAIAELKKGVW